MVLSVRPLFMDAQGTATITDDDPLPPPQVGGSDPVANESDAVATFTLTLDQAPQETVSVQVARPRRARARRRTSAALQIQVTFDPDSCRQPSRSSSTPTPGRGDENFTLELSGAQGLGIADPSGTATITDDDTSPGVTIDDVVVPEGDEGTSPATFTVSLDAPSGRIVTVADPRSARPLRPVTTPAARAS